MPVVGNKRGSATDDAVDISILMGFLNAGATLQEYADIYLTQAFSDLQDLSAQCTDGDNQKWVDVAHRMKGGAGMTGARYLHRLCAQAQAMNPARKEERTTMVATMENALIEVQAFFFLGKFKPSGLGDLAEEE